MKNKSSTKTIYRWFQLILVMILISSVILGCQKRGLITKDITLETVDPNKEGIIIPTQTSEPRLDLPPALIESYPLPETIIALDQAITLIFNQEMDTSSVEAAVHFGPRVSGRFKWEDGRTLTFTPDQALTPGSQLQLRIDTSAQALNKQSLQNPVELNYQVTDLLEVTQTLPENGAMDIDPQSIIFVSFNQPVVPMGDQINTQEGFTISPNVKGEGFWLNTSTYVIKPETSMNGGTNYSIQINPELLSTSGATLNPKDVRKINFVTARPAIEKVSPFTDEKLSLDGPIVIEFNIRMNPESVETNFKLTGPGQKDISGSFNWDESFKAVSFVPDTLLERDTVYQIKLNAEAESDGGLTLGSGLDTTRTTYPAFSIDTRFIPEFESFYAGYGQYQLRFTTNIDPKGLEGHIQIIPDVPNLSFFTGDTEQSLWISGYFQPETIYSLSVDAELKDIWGEQLGERFTTTFKTPSAKPSMELVGGYTSYGLLFAPASHPELVLQTTNLNIISVEVSQISLFDLLTLVNPENYQYRDIFLPEVRETTLHQIDLHKNKRQLITIPLTYHGEPLKPGIYFVGLSNSEIEDDWNRYQKYYIIVSDNNLVLKVAPDQMFVWGTQLNDLEPLLDTAVSIYDTDGELVNKGKFDSHGFFIDSIERNFEDYSIYFAMVGEPGSTDFGFTISTWQDGYILYQRGINVNNNPVLLDAYIYTDRQIYRPGDTINFKTIVFARDNGLPASSGEDRVKIVINGDPGFSGRPRTLFSKTLSLNQFGSASGSVVLPEDAATGLYWVDAYIGDNLIKSLYFDVASYRKPDIDLSVEFTQNEIKSDEEINGNAQAFYFFGMPAEDQPYTWTIYKKDVGFNLPGYLVGPADEFWTRPYLPDYYPLGSFVTNGEGLTGADGQIEVSISPDELEIGNHRIGKTYEYNLEVTLMEPSGFAVSDRDSITLHPDTFYIGVRPDTFFGNAGTAFDFSILTTDWQKQPVDEIPIDATFESIRWHVVETGSPENPYRYEAETELIGSSSPVTDKSGKARLSFTPMNPGTYRLTVASGRALTEVLIWVQGESGAIWPIQMQNWIDLTADLDEYQPGQIAEIFIPNPFTRDAKALLTIERGQIMSKHVLDIEGAGAVFSVPINDEMIPNFYISAIILGKDAQKRPDFRQGIINLAVPPTKKTLNMDLTALPSITEPGKKISLELKITDQSGKPIQGEFSISLVDKAVLSLIAPNSQSILDALYGEMPLSVETSLSLFPYAKQLALSPIEVGGLGGGADAIINTTTRKDFPASAFWEGQVITGADGTAQLTVPLPDSLTTWVAEARGITESYLVGQTEVEIITQKPLMIEPVTPRFVVDGDVIELGAVVYNNTEIDLQVETSLNAVGFNLATDNPSKVVTVSAGNSQKVTWWGTVESVKTIDLEFAAKSGEFSDASAPIWGDIEVLSYLMPQTFSTAGQLTNAGKRLELISLPVLTDPSSGNLSVTLNASLLGTLIDGLEALDAAPYTDSVTELSRLLANLSTYSVINSLNIDLEQIELDLHALIDDSINRILTSQHYDGGWHWWGGMQNEVSNSDPFITAYVLFGLESAKIMGFDVEDNFLTLAKDYLVFNLEDPDEISESWKLDLLTFIGFALRHHTVDIQPTLHSLFDNRNELSPWAKGLLALTMKEKDGMNANVKTLLSDLENEAIRSATSTHWEGQGLSWMLPGTPNFNTAAVIYAIAQLDPASQSLTPGLQYLLAHQDSRSWWSSSFETAWVIMAIPKVIQGTGGYLSDFTFEATLNSGLLMEGEAIGSAYTDPIAKSVSMDSLHKDTPNALMIRREEGAGTLYYRADLQTYQPAETAKAIQGGIHVEREYFLYGAGCPFAENCEPLNSIKLEPSEPPQFIRVAVTVNLPHDVYNLMVEDFIPAGTEIFNQRLLTSPTLIESPDVNFDSINPFVDGWGWWYFTPPQIYDDHILWTAEYVPAGTYTLTYELLPYQRGTYQVLPARAWLFFFPEVQGTSKGRIFEIE